MKRQRRRTALLFGKKLLLEKKQKIGSVRFELVRAAGGRRGYFIRASHGLRRDRMGFLFGTQACGTPQLAAFAAEDMVRRMSITLARLIGWKLTRQTMA